MCLKDNKAGRLSVFCLFAFLDIFVGAHGLSEWLGGVSLVAAHRVLLWSTDSRACGLSACGAWAL